MAGEWETYHIVTERNDNELCILCPFLDVRSNDGNVPEIQSGIDFVHDVEGCRLVMMQSEDQCK